MKDSGFEGDEWGAPTQWSLIERAAGQRPDVDTQRAWRELLARYRPAVEQSVRRSLRNHPQWPEAAADFFAYLFEQELLPCVDRDRGRFRCYMQGVLRRFALQWLRAQGRSSALDVDEFALENSDSEAEFERAEEGAWAQNVLRNAVERLQRSHPREAEFLLRAYGVAPRTPATREELCAEFGVNANQLNVAIHRARGWLEDELQSELRQLVRGARECEEEHAWMLARLIEANPGLFASATSA